MQNAARNPGCAAKPGETADSTGRWPEGPPWPSVRGRSGLREDEDSYRARLIGGQRERREPGPERVKLPHVPEIAEIRQPWTAIGEHRDCVPRVPRRCRRGPVGTPAGRRSVQSGPRDPHPGCGEQHRPPSRSPIPPVPSCSRPPRPPKSPAPRAGTAPRQTPKTHCQAENLHERDCAAVHPAVRLPLLTRHRQPESGRRRNRSPGRSPCTVNHCAAVNASMMPAPPSGAASSSTVGGSRCPAAAAHPDRPIEAAQPACGAAVSPGVLHHCRIRPVRSRHPCRRGRTG